MKEGFSKIVFWLLISLFLLTASVAAYWIWSYIRDIWIGNQEVVAGRFDIFAISRIIAVAFAAVAIPSGLLWWHYNRIDSYGSPLGLFFSIVFGLSLIFATIMALPAIFGS